MVTGGAGFIGSHLVDALIGKGAEVSVVDNLITGRRENLNPKAKFYKLDINSPAFENIFKKEKPELVYMLAFNTNVPKSVREPLFDVLSITGSLRTLEFAKKYGIKRKSYFLPQVLFTAIPKICRLKRLGRPCPRTRYIISKHAVENYIQFYGKAYGLDYVIFRYATTYGPRQIGGAMADYIRSIAADKQAEISGDGSKTRDYMFVGDIVRANLMAASYKTQKGITPLFNLSTGKETTLYQLYKKIGKLLGRPQAHPKFCPDHSGEMYRSRLDNCKA